MLDGTKFPVIGAKFPKFLPNEPISFVKNLSHLSHLYTDRNRQHRIMPANPIYFVKLRNQNHALLGEIIFSDLRIT